MGFDLVNLANEEHYIHASIWSWGTTVELIATFDVIDSERMKSMCYNGATVVTAEEAGEIGRRLQAKISEMKRGERLLIDLSVTDIPDDYKLHRDDLSKNYSATYDWLEKFAAFCLASEGFTVY